MPDQGERPTGGEAATPAGFVRFTRRRLPPEARPLHRGCIGPLARLPQRRPGTCRRTTTVDVVRPDGLFGDLVLVGRGRDLATRADGTTHVVAEGACRLTVEPVAGRRVLAATAEPADGDVGALVGVRAASGFRAAMAELLPRERATESVVHQLLDDVPAAALISGSVLARNGYVVRDPDGPHGLPPVGTCAGWAEGAAMTREARATGISSYVGEGPPVPPAPVTDPLALHAVDPLVPSSYRRLRLIDATPAADGSATAFVFFRDSYVEPDGVETVVHEYSLAVAVSAARRVERVEVVAHVLPGPDCIGARESASRVRGTPIGEIRARVRGELVGPSTCTHLNDTLRSLGGLRPLLASEP